MNLSYNFLTRDSLKNSDIDEMFDLMKHSYENVEYSDFLKDLGKKQYVGLLTTDDRRIAGFTTFVVREFNGSEHFDVLFSGDTIIGNSFRGTQELIRGVGRSFGSFLAKSESNNKELFWLLTTKGHRTYMYLPLFFRTYYPDQTEEYASYYRERLNAVCSQLFPDSWAPDQGLLIHDAAASKLNSQEALATHQRNRNPHVEYFLRRNPDFQAGTELACIAQISVDNIISFGKKYVLDGLENPLC
ncbi:MAG TPA: hypothetical protein DEA96_06725 [Leptospiraceae bacterium]|nr:hypothetical protein [Spirochaetaceae bacterium]HBS04638.1 hypothetical protein [Leptospiraceae bacterium]|tara:strand:- start:65435 stop:66166 length:732 start_codon:yes stop_codon:yes gene_type:complete